MDSGFQVWPNDILLHGLAAGVLLGYVRTKQANGGGGWLSLAQLTDLLQTKPLPAIHALAEKRLIRAHWQGDMVNLSLNETLSAAAIQSIDLYENVPRNWSVQPSSRTILQNKYGIADTLIDFLEDEFRATPREKKPTQCWEERFLAYAIHTHRQYTNQREEGKGARLQQITNDWQPGDKAVRHLIETEQIPEQHLRERILPEFRLYWKERGQINTPITWDGLFVGYAIKNFAGSGH